MPSRSIYTSRSQQKNMEGHPLKTCPTPQENPPSNRTPPPPPRKKEKQHTGAAPCLWGPIPKIPHSADRGSAPQKKAELFLDPPKGAFWRFFKIQKPPINTPTGGCCSSLLSTSQVFTNFAWALGRLSSAPSFALAVAFAAATGRLQECDVQGLANLIWGMGVAWVAVMARGLFGWGKGRSCGFFWWFV